MGDSRGPADANRILQERDANDSEECWLSLIGPKELYILHKSVKLWKILADWHKTQLKLQWEIKIDAVINLIISAS
jgi:hypothetical protein